MYKLLTALLIACSISLFLATMPLVASADATVANTATTQTNLPAANFTQNHTVLKHQTFDYFSPTYIYCRVYAPCVIVTNGLNRPVLLYRYDWPYRAMWLAPRASQSLAFWQHGTYYVGIRNGYMRVPLTITVYGSYYGRGYGSWRE